MNNRVYELASQVEHELFQENKMVFSTLVADYFAERLAEIANLESMPKMEGRRMLAMFAPKGKKKVEKPQG